jgi:hypothetical protein
MTLTAMPRFINISQDLVMLDLRYLLAKILIDRQRLPLSQILLLPNYRNPYDGSFPFLDENKICFTHPEKNVCVSL